MKVLLFLGFVFLATSSIAQVSLSTINSPYTQDFNTLANTGTSTALPTGWFLNEAGGNTFYAAGTGSDNAGNTYSFGAASNSDRAFGGILSGSVNPTIGASFTNNTGSTITSLDIAYFGEQWRLGATGRFDQIDFQYSLNATSLTSGAWTDVNSLDFIAPNSTGTVGALDGNAAGNRISISSSITGLSIAAGATFWIKWTDFNASGSDDGLGIDDFSITPQASISNTFTITNLSSTFFSVDCSTPDSGSIEFTSTGTFNAGNTFTAQLSNASGSFASPVNLATSVSASGVDPSGTINFTIPAGTATGTGYRIRIISSNPSVTSPDNGNNISITNSPCTITTGAVSGGPFSVTCLTGMDGTVSFTSLGSFSAGNEFIVQLSNSSGSFAAPITIGSQDSTLSVGSNPSGTINFSIPAELPSGNYLIRVVSTNPVIIGSNSAAFNITLTGGPCTLTPPYFSSAIINSCNPTCPEGHNELVFGNTGDYSVLVNTTNFNMSYGTTLPLTEYTDVLVSNAATTAAINAAAGCPGTFLNGTGVTLPAGASFILAPTQLCIDALSWSGLCGSGPIYMIYQDDLNWNLNGTFKNGNTGGTRYFNSTIRTTTAETFSINYNNNSTLLQNGLNGDGDYVSWGPNGGTATYGDNNCILTPVLLPTTTVNFKAFNEQGKNLLFWQTQSEQNNDYFTLQHSTDGVNYAEIGRLQGTGNSNALINYSFTHNRPPRGINYYKLTSTDYDGTNYIKSIASVMVEGEGTYFDPLTSQLKFGEKSDYSIYSTDGKLLGTENNTDSMEFQHHGMILIQDLRTLSIERLFIP